MLHSIGNMRRNQNYTIQLNGQVCFFLVFYVAWHMH